MQGYARRRRTGGLRGLEEGEGRCARMADLDPGPEQSPRGVNFQSHGSKDGQNRRFGHHGGNQEHPGEGGWSTFN